MDQPFPQDEPDLREIDPVILDVILATSFDWQDLANRLASAGRVLPERPSGILKLPQIVYRMSNTACRVDSRFSRDLGTALNFLHRRILEKVSGMEIDRLCIHVQEVSPKNRRGMAGLLWALASDSRPCVQKLSRVLLQRVMTEVFSSFYRADNDVFDEIVSTYSSEKTN